MTTNYIVFEESILDEKNILFIKNTKGEKLGRIEKTRVGAWLSWCLYLNIDCYMSASCLDEVREKIRKLNGELR